HRPAGVPALARLAACALLPTRRPLLDVPADRGGHLWRPRRGAPRGHGLVRAAVTVVTRETLDRRQLLRSLGVGAAALALPAAAEAATGAGFLAPHTRRALLRA